MHPAADAAISHRRIFCRGKNSAGMIDRVDHRRNNSPCAGIQGALDEVVISLRHATERHAAGVGHSGENHGRLRPVNRGMFQVERQPVESAASQHPGGVQISQR